MFSITAVLCCKL